VGASSYKGTEPHRGQADRKEWSHVIESSVSYVQKGAFEIDKLID
jgi:hypothetical protein